MSQSWLLVDLSRSAPQTCWLFSSDGGRFHAGDHSRETNDSRISSPSRHKNGSAGVDVDAAIQGLDTVYEHYEHLSRRFVWSEHATVTPLSSLRPDVRAAPASDCSSMVRTVSPAPSWVCNLNDPFNTWGQHDLPHHTADTTRAAAQTSDQRVGPDALTRVEQRTIDTAEISDGVPVSHVTSGHPKPPSVPQGAVVMDEPHESGSQTTAGICTSRGTDSIITAVVCDTRPSLAREPHTSFLNHDPSQRWVCSQWPAATTAEWGADHQHDILTEQHRPKLSTENVANANIAADSQASTHDLIQDKVAYPDCTRSRGTSSPQQRQPSPVPCPSLLAPGSLSAVTVSGPAEDSLSLCLGSHSQAPSGVTAGVGQVENVQDVSPIVERGGMETVEICPDIQNPLKVTKPSHADVPPFVKVDHTSAITHDPATPRTLRRSARLRSKPAELASRMTGPRTGRTRQMARNSTAVDSARAQAKSDHTFHLRRCR
ncbi:hypothetical protein C8T65DRAFT_644044 [Cerioporus squamosus]|nr:hypothetical protein C8T65DRAFT_644044 [Cerioporus squamosus]